MTPGIGCSWPYRSASLVTAACLGCASLALAQGSDPNADRELTITFGGGHSDNVLRASQDERSATYRAVGFIANYEHDGSRLLASLLADIEHRDYSADDIEDEPYGSFDGSAEFQMLPERISWLIVDSYGQGRTDPFRIDSPANQEQINVFSTGPRFEVPLGARTALDLAATYSDRSFDETRNLDSESTIYAMTFLRSVSRTAQVGLNFSTRRTEYDPPDPAHDVDTAYFSYTRELATGEAALALGTSRLESVSDESSTPFVDVSWERDVATRSHLVLAFQNDFVDAAQSFGDSQGQNDVLLSTDVYQESNASIEYDIELPRTSLSIRGGTYRSRYEIETNLDSDRTEIGLDVQRSVSERLDIGLTIDSSKREFVQTSRRDEDLREELWLEKGFGRGFSVRFSYARLSRAGEQTDEFDEDTFRILLRYAVSSNEST